MVACELPAYGYLQCCIDTPTCRDTHAVNQLDAEVHGAVAFRCCPGDVLRSLVIGTCPWGFLQLENVSRSFCPTDTVQTWILSAFLFSQRTQVAEKLLLVCVEVISACFPEVQFLSGPAQGSEADDAPGFWNEDQDSEFSSAGGAPGPGEEHADGKGVGDHVPRLRRRKPKWQRDVETAIGASRLRSHLEESKQFEGSRVKRVRASVPAPEPTPKQRFVDHHRLCVRLAPARQTSPPNLQSHR